MKSYIKYYLLINFCILLNSCSGNYELSQQPYLQAVTSNSIYVLYESNNTDKVKVKYGRDDYELETVTESFEMTTAGTYIHNIQLNMLKPGSRYKYKITNRNNSGKEYSFITAVSDNIPFSFAWMADCRTGTDVHNRIAGYIKEHKPNFSLYGGDLAVSSSYQAWKDEFFVPNETDIITEIPFFNTPGNHEDWLQNTKAFTQSPFSSSGTQDYYSFDYGNMHVLVLNNMVDYSKGSAQYEFAERDLRESFKTWKVVTCHYPAYCSGGHGEDEAMIEMSKDIFDKNNVNLVLSGHNHFYQHNKVNNIHYIIAGSAGSPLYEPTNSWYTIKSIKQYQFLIIDINGNSMTIKCYNDNNQLLDEIILSK